MALLAIVLALLIEQVRPLAARNAPAAWLRQWVRGVSHNIDAGNSGLAWLAWALAVVVPAVVAAVVYWALKTWLGWPAALLFNVGVLYLTLGFRQFSHHFTAIREALESADDARARQLLAQWQQVDASELPRTEIVRHVIEYAVLAAHRHVFGVLSWFTVLSALGLGPAGAIFYRNAAFAARYWPRKAEGPSHGASPQLRDAALAAWRWTDWLPARMTALSFAVVGNFEEAVDAWRRYGAQAGPRGPDNDGLIQAATAGALDVRLGGVALRPAAARAGNGEQPPAGPHLAADGREAQTGHLAQVVGLVWRAVALWLLVLVLLTLARVTG